MSDTFDKAATRSIVQFLGTICGTYQKDTVVFAGSCTI